MAAILKVWRHIRNPTPVNRCVSLEEQSFAKFHPDPIWNDWALIRLFGSDRPDKNKKKKRKNQMSSVMGSDQVPDPKI